MFIELTDHLRCPADHDESFLVLIPDEMDGRDVVRGMLGCPVCQQEYPIVSREVEFGIPDPGAAAERGEATPDAAALSTLLGLEGAGGYLALIGEAAAQAAGMATILPGVHLVLVNPPEGTHPLPGASIIHTPVLPLKQRSLRGLVLGRPWSTQAGWSDAAAHAVLPGLRLAGTGAVPATARFELLGQADGWWVGRAG
jgi:uncharacterized protein YbaR (Trm112 family)